MTYNRAFNSPHTYSLVWINIPNIKTIRWHFSRRPMNSTYAFSKGHRGPGSHSLQLHFGRMQGLELRGASTYVNIP